MRVAMLVLNDMSFDQRVHREASALGAAGHDVRVFCLRGRGLPAEETRDGYRVLRVADSTTATWKNPVQKIRQSRLRTRLMATAAAGLRPHIVHVHDTDALPAGYHAAQASRSKLVYDAHELFPDQFADTAWFARAYWRGVERRLIPRSDAAITVSPGLAQVLRSRFGVEPWVIRNVPPLLPLLESSRLRDELEVPDGVALVLYQGLLLPERGLVALVEAMADVADAVLVIQGTGPEEERMRRAVHEHGLGRKVRFMGWIDPRDAHEYACGADVGVVTYEAPTLNNRLAGPNKLFVYLMAGLPVVARDFQGLRDIVAGDRVGEVFRSAISSDIAAALNRLLRDRQALAGISKRARALAESTYNWQRESTALLALYDSLLEEGALQ